MWLKMEEQSLWIVCKGRESRPKKERDKSSKHKRRQTRQPRNAAALPHISQLSLSQQALVKVPHKVSECSVQSHKERPLDSSLVLGAEDSVPIKLSYQRRVPSMMVFGVA